MRRRDSRPLLAALAAVLAFSACSTARASQPVVLFDEAHGQQFVIERSDPLDLSGLAGLFSEAGFEVRSTGEPITRESLAGVDVLISSGAFQPYVPDEIDAVRGFVRSGGRVAVMLHIAPPLAPLLGAFDVLTSNGVVREAEAVQDGEPLNFRVSRIAEHPSMERVPGYVTYGTWALLAEGSRAQSVAATGPAAWVDLDGDGTRSANDATGSIDIAVAGKHGEGRFIVFGDDAIFQNRFLTGENLRLGEQLARWLR